MIKKPVNLHPLQTKVKNVSSFFLSLLLIASTVTSCVLVSHNDEMVDNFTFSLNQQDVVDGPVLTASEIKLGFENLTRSFQNVANPFSKVDDASYMEFVKKFHSTYTKVSFKYLYFLHRFQSGEEQLFLDLRKLLI